MDNRWKLLEQYGELFCAKCHSSIVCDECGDMPEQCPVCGAKFNWLKICCKHFGQHSQLLVSRRVLRKMTVSPRKIEVR